MLRLVAAGSTNREIAARLLPERGHREEPHLPHPGPARPARPHPGRDLRPRPRPPLALGRHGGPAGGSVLHSLLKKAPAEDDHGQRALARTGGRRWHPRAPRPHPPGWSSAPVRSRPARCGWWSARLPAPGPGELLLRVRTCGVCRTDLHLAEGDLAPRKATLLAGPRGRGRGDRHRARVPSTSASVTGRGRPGWREPAGSAATAVPARENLCPDSRYTGWDIHGGFADHVVVDADSPTACRKGGATRRPRHCCARESSATGRCSGPTCRPAAGSASTGSAPPRI